MESLVTYLIRCVLVSGLLASYYVLVLRGRRMHGFNRFYLLSSVVAALVLPLIHIPWAPWAANHATVERVVIGLSPREAGQRGGSFWALFATGASVLVSIVLLIASFMKIRALYKLKRVSRCTFLDDYELVETDAPGTPFSFLRNLFWQSGMDPEEDVNRKILAHELAHIHGRHSWDILAMQTVVSVFWMNPFFWYIRRELTLVLEFEADAASGAAGDPEALARMLLQAYRGGFSPALSNSFFHSPIKRRLVMITKTHSGRRAWMRKALVAPVVAGAVLFFACSKEESPQAAKVSPTPPSAPTISVDGPSRPVLRTDTVFLTTSTGKVNKVVPIVIEDKKDTIKLEVNRIDVKN